MAGGRPQHRARIRRYLIDGHGRPDQGRDALLPRERFRLHTQRSLICTTPEQASFLTCARCGSTPIVSGRRRSLAAPHWRSRPRSHAPSAKTLVDPRAPARRRAATPLARMDEPRVHGHLCHTALEDS